MENKKITLRKLVILLVLLVAGKFVVAQSGWEQVYTGSNQFLRDMVFVPGPDGLWQTGWVIAFEGDILKTTDGGDTWTTLSQNISTSLSAISFADQDTGYICTLDNKIIKTTDGGTTWTTVYNGSVNFDKIQFKDGHNGVALGTQKLYTSDGGATWSTGTGGSNYWDLDYAEGDTYFGAYLGGALGKSTDGGATWTDVASLGQMAGMVDFLDGTYGMFGGDVSTVKTTTDGGATWTTNQVGSGQGFLACGGYYDKDTLYVTGSPGEVSKSTDGGQTWSTDTTVTGQSFRGMVVTPFNVVFMCGKEDNSSVGTIWRKIGESPLQADFEADVTATCVGSSVDFTDLSIGAITSWDWSFEGGTPSSSSDQNPTVTYNSTGVFDVELTITDEFGDDTKLKVDYITILDTPDKADMPDGETSVCTGLTYEYSIDPVEFAQAYDWEIDPASAGILTWADTLATLETDDTWTGDFTIRARATNICGDGEWSDELQVTLNMSPDEFETEGGGGYCLNGEGVEVTLNGSQTGVDYELYIDDVPTGVIIAGTGSELSFGLQTDEGYYTVMANNGNCEIPMMGQVQVYIEFPPLEPGMPSGPGLVCNDTVSTYTSTGVDDADSYVWVLSPEDAGTLTYDGLEATVEWSVDFSGTADVSLYGVNDCGDGNPSTALEVQVDAVPAPEIDGQDMVCDFSEEIYEVADNDGNSYEWTVTGGTITSGDSTYMITVEWGGVGTGSVSVSVETAAGCSGTSEVMDITIDDCTGINDPEQENTISVFPNPAGDFVTVQSAGKIVSVSIYALSGELIVNKPEGVSNNKLNTSNINPGLYLIRIVTETGVVTKRLVIE